jgi:type II secretory pathway pseudopilin PulG
LEVRVKIRSGQGFAIIDLLFVCAIIGIISGIALPKLVTARGSAYAASAIASMRTINSAQLTFAITCGNGFYAPNLTSLAKLPPGSTDGYIKGDLGSADTVIKSAYTIQMSGTPFAGSPDTCNALGVGTTALAFKAGADPVDVTGTRFFAINANGSIFEDTATLFATMPEDLDPATGHTLH